jgi:hypothetical protein
MIDFVSRTTSAEGARGSGITHQNRWEPPNTSILQPNAQIILDTDAPRLRHTHFDAIIQNKFTFCETSGPNAQCCQYEGVHLLGTFAGKVYDRKQEQIVSSTGSHGRWHRTSTGLTPPFTAQICKRLPPTNYSSNGFCQCMQTKDHPNRH